MEDNREDQKRTSKIAFESLEILVQKWIDGSLKEILDDWKWIFSYSKKYKWAIVFYTVMGIVNTTLGLLTTVMSKYLVDVVTGYQTDKLWVLITVAVSSTLFSLTIGNWLNRFNLKLSINISNDIQADIFDKIIDADWYSLSQYPNGDLLHRFGSDVSTIGSNAVGWIPSIVLVVYNFVATFLLLLYYDPVMAALAFVGAPFHFAFNAILMKKRRAYAKRAKEMGADITSFQVETFYNFDTIKSFGITDYYSKKLRWWQKKAKDFNLEYNMFNIKTGIIASLFNFALNGSIFGYCLWLLWSRQITYGTMQLFMAQRSKLAGSFGSLVGIIPRFLNTSISAHRIRELVDLPREPHVERSSELDAFAQDGFSVEMRDLTFGYVEDKRVINDSELTARPGEIVALVGPSGEGKTTLIRLILGLVQPGSGDVVIRAQNGFELPANADTRHLFSYVPQGNTILSGTIAENLRMIKEDATDEEIIEALKIACAWDFVSRMPDTINFKLGERGRGLSEGQAQRIAIARAVLRDAPLLLLDEATSALDVVTERQVLSNIIKQRPNKTCIVTTHRPSVLSMCQRVYRVMDTKITALSEEEAGRMAIDF